MKTIVITLDTPDDIPASLLRALEAKVHDRILANGGSCGEVHATECRDAEPEFYVYEWRNKSDDGVFRSFSPDEYSMGRDPDRVIPVTAKLKPLIELPVVDMEASE